MGFDLEKSLDVLRRTPRVLRSLLSGLDPEWLENNYGEGTFTPFDVVGHLITGEQTDWIPRARLILDHGVTRPFDRYDRYAHFEAGRGKSIDDLLDEFERARAESLAALRRLDLQPDDLQRRGLHPALGEVTLGQLLATWVAHDMNHLAQIARGIAARHEQAVGPWREYLGIFRAPVTRMDAEGEARKRASKAAPPTSSD